MGRADDDYRAATARLLADRVRVGVRLCVAGTLAFWVADRDPNLLGARLLQVLMLVGLVTGDRFVRRASGLGTAVATTFGMATTLCVFTAAVGPLFDVATSVLVLIVVAMGTATLFPWGARVQAALAVVAGLAAAWLATYVGGTLDGHPAVVGVALAFGVSVVVAWVLERERRERWLAERALAASQARLAGEAAVAGMLARVTREMVSLLESPAILRRLGTATIDALAADCSHTFLWSDRDDAFVVVTACGTPAEHVRASEGRRIPRATLASVLAELRHADGGVTTLVSPLPAALGCPSQQTTAMALRWGDEVVGIHTAGRSVRLAGLTDAQRRFACSLAQTVSQALAKARLVEELRETSSQKTEFVSTMSHELRTPINVLLGYLEMLDDPSVGATERLDLGSRMRASGRDLLEMVESLLELGRIESGRDRPRRETIRLRPFWTELGDACRRLPRAPDVAFEWASNVPDVDVVVDPRRLTIVVRNLVGNALKFTERGAVGASARIDDGRLILEIRDTGIGIRPEEQAVVFEMFRRAADGGGRPGSGLGLHIVRTFVARMGGDVRLESAHGVGSRFVVTLPVEGAPAARAA